MRKVYINFGIAGFKKHFREAISTRMASRWMPYLNCITQSAAKAMKCLGKGTLTSLGEASNMYSFFIRAQKS